MTALDRSIVATAALATVVTWWLSNRTVEAAAVTALAFGGAALAAALVPRNPVAAVGIVIVLSPMGRLVVELPIGTMRVEQPAIAALLIATAIHWRTLRGARLQPLLPLLIAAGAYLVVLAASSVLVAPNPAASMHIVLWTLLSMAGGLAAALLTAGRSYAQVADWFIAAAVITAIVGIVVAIAFYVAGPGVTGVDGPLGPTPKVAALAHEANLYAIFLAAVAPLAAERFRSAPTWRSATAVALILAAIGIGVTRSAYISLLIGLPVYLALVYWRAAGRGLILRAAAICVAAALAGALIASVLLDPAHRDADLVARGLQPPTPPGPSSPGPPTLDMATLDFRLERIGPAMTEFTTSPLIGLGAYSYEQRHQLPAGTPDHIAILAVAVPYESGILGTVALAAFLALLLLRLRRTTKVPPKAAMAAAYIASIVILLIAYQATNALHFGFTWLIFGVAAGLTLAPQASVGAE